MVISEGELRPSIFGVFIENPYQIWQGIRDDLLARGNYKNISQLLRDPAREDATYTVSETNFGPTAPLFESEKTQLDILVGSGEPFCEISTSLSFGKQTKENPISDYYPESRLRYLGDILKNARFNVKAKIIQADWGSGYLEIGRNNEVYIQASMGVTTPKEALRFKARRIEQQKQRVNKFETTGAPKRIIEYEKKLLAKTESMTNTNTAISIRLTNYWKKDGGVGRRKISFRDHETFIKNLHFYSVFYQGLMEALYQERSLPTPKVPIVISNPKIA